MRSIRKIIVHCSDSDNPDHDNIETIKKWHVDENGWSDVGYHFFINKNGDIFKGRPVYINGAHCKGQNSDSIGVCISGSENFEKVQFESARMLLRELCFEFGLMNDQIFGHCHFDTGKTCPNFGVNDVLPF